MIQLPTQDSTNIITVVEVGVTTTHITVDQLHLMKHAIGYKADKVKNGRYEAYRNHYTVSGPDAEWDALVGQNLAFKCLFRPTGSNRITSYYVSEKGLKLLEKILGIRIEVTYR